MAPSKTIRIRPVDPDSQNDIVEMKRQRRICGWYEERVELNMQLVKSGRLALFFFHYVEDGTSESDVEHAPIIGSGGLDLDGAIEGREMSSHENKEFNVMGMFVYPEYRGRKFFRTMALALIEYGFVTLNLDSSTVMTNASNPITNRLFTGLGYVEYHREFRPNWHNPDDGIQYRISRKEWLQRNGATTRAENGGPPAT